MTDDTEAVALLRELHADMSKDGADSDFKYAATMTSVHQKVIAYLARRDEDADMAEVRKVLNMAINSGNWRGIDGSRSALDRIAARLRNGATVTCDFSTPYERGRNDEKAKAVNELRRRVGCLANPAFEKEHAALLDAVQAIERGDHLK